MSDNQVPFLLLIGPPGCGKSTWARRYFRGDTIVSSDRLRRRVSGQDHNQDATPWAIRIMHETVAGRARFGLPIVVDATNTVAEHRAPLLSAAYAWMRRPVAIVFDVPIDVCLDRNARRPARLRVPEGFIRDTHAQTLEQFPRVYGARSAEFHSVAWVVHNDGMYINVSITLDSAKYGHGDADWLDDARVPGGYTWNSPSGKSLEFRRPPKPDDDRAVASLGVDPALDLANQLQDPAFRARANSAGYISGAVTDATALLDAARADQPAAGEGETGR